MSHKITDKCKGVGECKKICPVDAIREGTPIFVIDPNLCIDCGACKSVCPYDAILSE